MKKIINITLGGRNIAIEDSAYEKIKAYTESLRLYYKNEEGRDEIIADIESRFSELMHEKIRKGAAHIADADVDEMIATMGRPEDFDNATAAEEGAAYSPNFTFAEKRRLYRDESNKMIGGVCSGIANWLNIDPTIVRVLFAIISFGAFGTGLLAYLLLWMFLPSRRLGSYSGKRMFRNPDDKVIGGVAGGIGAYFHKSSNTIRWIFAIPLILSVLKSIDFLGWGPGFGTLLFGGLTGTFILVYIILWIVLPEANSPYEKMEMYGKTIDVNAIKENVQNSMGDIKDRVQNWSKEVKDTAEKLGKKAGSFAQTRGPEFGREFGYAARRGGKGIGYVIAMIFKAFFVFIAGTIAISLFVAFLAFLFSGFAWAPINNFLWTSDQQQMWAWGTLLFFIGAPIVGLLVWLIRNISNIRTPGNYLNWMFGGLWTVGWVCLVMFITTISKDFKRNEMVETPVTIMQPSTGKMTIKVSQPELEYKGDFGWMNVNSLEGISITNDSLKIAGTVLNFEKSPDSLFHVKIIKESPGRTDEDALQRARNTMYAVASSDTILDLANGFSIDKQSKYRFQTVTVNIQVPVGKKINIDPSVYNKMNMIGFYLYKTNRRRMNNWKDGYTSSRRYRANVDYTMNSSGNLVSSDDVKQGNSNNQDGNYRWDSDGTDTTKTSATVFPASPETNKDTTNVYRYDAAAKPAQPVTEKTKAAIQKELQQKEKEINELKKKLNQ